MAKPIEQAVAVFVNMAEFLKNSSLSVSSHSSTPSLLSIQGHDVSDAVSLAASAEQFGGDMRVGVLADSAHFQFAIDREVGMATQTRQGIYASAAEEASVLSDKMSATSAKYRSSRKVS